jgi:hypothetical protein
MFIIDFFDIIHNFLTFNYSIIGLAVTINIIVAKMVTISNFSFIFIYKFIEDIIEGIGSGISIPIVIGVVIIGFGITYLWLRFGSQGNEGTPKDDPKDKGDDDEEKPSIPKKTKKTRKKKPEGLNSRKFKDK